MPPQVLEGTWEEIKLHEAELIGRHLRVTIVPSVKAKVPTRSAERPSALGKYAFVTGGSEEFAKEKQLEIEREDRDRE